MMYIIGPGHGGPGMVAHTYLEGSYTEIYPHIERNRGRNQAVVPAVFVAVRDSEPRCAGDAGLDSRRRGAGLFVAACVWRGFRQSESDRGLHRGRWRSGDRAVRDQLALEQVFESRDGWRGAADSAFEWIQDRESDGAGADSAGGAGIAVSRVRVQAVLSGGRRSGGRCTSRWRRCWTRCWTRLRRFRRRRARKANTERPRWPMLILRTPKGWTGPKMVDGKPVEGTWRAHQVPLRRCRDKSGALEACWKSGCAATSRRSCSTRTGRFVPELAELAPKGRRRMGMNPHANGGLLLEPLTIAGVSRLCGGD